MMNQNMHYDMILRNGHVLDPSRAIDRVMDVAIQGDRIAAMEANLPATAAVEYDTRGKYICPGLIDLHGHWYEGSCFGIDPDICLNHGVTTAVDAGTTGFINFPEFRRTSIANARVGVLAFIHIGCVGLPTTIVGELEDLRYARPVETAAVIADYRDSDLTSRIGRPGLRRAEANPQIVGAGVRTVAYLWIALPEGSVAPKTIAHTVEMDVLRPTGPVHVTVDGAMSNVSKEAATVLDPPLRILER